MTFRLHSRLVTPSVAFISLLIAGIAVRGEVATSTSPRAPKGPIADVYQRAAPAVVGIECLLKVDKRVFQYFGSGVIVDPAGVVLTSISVVPEKATDIFVFLRGGLSYKAKTLRTEGEKELSLLAIENGANFPYLPLGDSDDVGVGQFALTLGNAFHSIRRDDQVTIAAGLVSGRYDLAETRSQAKYVGNVIETTAAVNDGMDGGPLLNSRGEIVGLLSLNFSTSRWLGTAIPINVLKPLMESFRRSYSDRGRDAFLGFEVVQGVAPRDGESAPLRIDRVFAKSPARRAGLRSGQLLFAINGEPVSSLDGLRDLLSAAKSASRVRLQVSAPSTDPKFTTNFMAVTTGVFADGGEATREVSVPVRRRF